MKTFKVTDSNREVMRVSRWIRLEYTEVSPRSKFWYYSDSGSLIYFKFRGKRYALGQFTRFGYGGGKDVMFSDKNGHYSLVAYDSEDYYLPLMLEIDASGKYVRLYQDVI